MQPGFSKKKKSILFVLCDVVIKLRITQISISIKYSIYFSFNILSESVLCRLFQQMNSNSLHRLVKSIGFESNKINEY